MDLFRTAPGGSKAIGDCLTFRERNINIVLHLENNSLYLYPTHCMWLSKKVDEALQEA